MSERDEPDWAVFGCASVLIVLIVCVTVYEILKMFLVNG